MRSFTNIIQIYLQNNKVALDVLTNFSEDSELRIRAFQLLIASPSSTTAETVRKLLDFEPDSQSTT